MGRSNRVRIGAVAQWLAVAYPTPHTVVVKLIRNLRGDKIRLDGLSYWSTSSRCQVVLLKQNQTFTSMLDTLAHEWAHLVHMPNNRQHARRDLRPHDPLTGWGNTYAAIYSDLFDDPVKFKA